MFNKKDKVNSYIIRKLANILPAIDVKVAESITVFFVEQTLLEIGNNKSLNDVRKGIREIFLLNFDSKEVLEAINNLKGNKKIVEDKNRYSLEIKYFEKLKQKYSETKQKEEKIFNDWLVNISKKYPELKKEDENNLKFDLQLYLNKIFLQHGVECASFVYPNNEASQLKVGKYDKEEIYNVLPKRDYKLDEIRKIEFPLFLKETDENKQSYYSCVLDGMFIYNSIQIDPQLKGFLVDSFNKYVFFLDTNVLYSLFDLGNIKSRNEIEKLLSKAKNFGIKLCVSERTVKEMKKSVELKGEELSRSRSIKRELADIGANLTSEDNFVTAYWRAYHQTGITKDDFIYKFTHVEELLKHKEIEVVYDTPDFSESELEEEKAKLMELVATKTQNTAEHDAYHKILINYLRGESKKDNTFNKYWFLTIDGSLDHYNKETREKGESPFSMMLHQFLQILRPLAERTQDFDKTFFELFSKPHIKSSHNILPFNMAEQIMTTISSYKELPDSVAIDIIMDGKFREVILKNGSDKNEEEIENLVKNEITNEMKKMRERIKILEEKQEAAEEARQREKEEFEKKLAESKKEITTTRGELNKKNQNLAKNNNELIRTKDEVVKINQDVSGKDRKINSLQLALIITLFILLIFVDVVLYNTVFFKTTTLIQCFIVVLNLLFFVMIVGIKYHINKAMGYLLILATLIPFVIGAVKWLNLGKPLDNNKVSTDEVNSSIIKEMISTSSTESIDVKNINNKDGKLNE